MRSVRTRKQRPEKKLEKKMLRANKSDHAERLYLCLVGSGLKVCRGSGNDFAVFLRKNIDLLASCTETQKRQTLLPTARMMKFYFEACCIATVGALAKERPDIIVFCVLHHGQTGNRPSHFVLKSSLTFQLACSQMFFLLPPVPAFVSITHGAQQSHLLLVDVRLNLVNSSYVSLVLAPQKNEGDIKELCAIV